MEFPFSVKSYLVRRLFSFRSIERIIIRKCDDVAVLFVSLDNGGVFPIVSFLISIFFSNLFILNLYKQINNSLFLFRILLVCEIFYKLPCGPRASAAGSQSVSLRFHYKLVLRHIYAVFFCKFNNNARIQIFVRS